MEIRLRGIGMIEDSEIKLDGLTVVTGENNSGKTTIGKALYALVDAASDLSRKAEEDKDAYLLNALLELGDYGAFRSLWRESPAVYQAEYPALFALSSYVFDRNYTSHIPAPELFARQVEEELKAILRSLDADEETIASQKTLRPFLDYYSRMARIRKIQNRETPAADNEEIAKSRLRKQIESFLRTLRNCFETINADPLFTAYVKDSVSSMLREEFSKQIQPVHAANPYSSVSLSEDDLPFFEIRLRRNLVMKSDFHEMPLKKAFFVDNPIALDYNFVQLILSYQNSVSGDAGLRSYFNPRRTRSHMARLSAILRGGEELSPIEQRALNEKLAPVKAKINAVVPGTFDFSGAEEFYVSPEGDKLRLTNLAAGSKMFSIIKLLLENGKLDENSMLILDEPEIHLHPQWQNQLAEVIALLVEELHIRVLLTTHSFEFMLALETWAKKYHLGERANFYLSRRLENGLVTHERKTDNLGAIYDELVAPTEEMDALRDSLNAADAEGGDGA